jgi:hypothetical protein
LTAQIRYERLQRAFAAWGFAVETPLMASGHGQRPDGTLPS